MKALVFAIDDAYIVPLKVFWHSLYQTNSIPNDVAIFILHESSLSMASQNDLIEFFKIYNAAPCFIDLADKLPDYLPIGASAHVSRATYYRLFCTSILPSEIDYAVYLDVDMLAMGSIRGLFSLDLTDFPIAAVDHFSPRDELRLWGPVGGSYFNAGVIVINLAWWRTNNIQKVFLEILSNHSSRLSNWDQCVLNIAFANRWLRLPIWYNMNHITRQLITKHWVLFETKIFHYTSRRKPWNCEAPDEAELLWHRALCELDDYLPSSDYKSIIHKEYANKRPICYDTRKALIEDLLVDGMSIAEIGVFEGQFAQDILASIKPSIFYMVDLFSGKAVSGDKDGNHVKQVEMEPIYDQLKAKYAGEHSIQVVKKSSNEFFQALDENHLDAVYIDADHSYKGCKADLEAALRVVKNGGFILGHDYSFNPVRATRTYDFGVKKAVDEFCRSHNLAIFANAMDGCISYAIKIDK